MRQYSGKRLNIKTPITKINTTESWYCFGNCSKVPSCTSVNVRKAENIGNCWIFSEMHTIGGINWKTTTTGTTSLFM